MRSRPEGNSPSSARDRTTTRYSVVIFDEATLSLDSATEQAIQERLAEASRGTSTLIIAHRLSTMINADETLVLDRGQVAEPAAE